MSSLDFDLDAQMIALESEWRHAYEASILAQEEYQCLVAGRKARSAALDRARGQLERAEALKTRIMAKIERLEASLCGPE
jgi:hypothetical protein